MPNPTSTTPHLRFPEFSGEWQKSKLGDLINHMGGTSLEEHVTSKGTHKFISIGNYHPNGTYIDDGKRININDKTKAKLLNKDDLVMVLNDKTLSGDIIGSTIIIDKDDVYIYNQRSERITAKSDIVLPHFLWVVLNTINFRKSLVHLSQGNTQIYVNFPVVKGLNVSIPQNIDEQQKIASFLTKVDTWITNFKSQKQNLENYKKSLTQKIFSQQIRFKDEGGKGYLVWETKKIKAILKIGSGRDYKHLETGSVPVFGTGGYMLSVNQKLGTGETVFIGRKGTISKPFYYNGDFWTVDTLFYTYDYAGVIPKFVAILFSIINWLKHNEASGVPSLSKNTIENIKINIPSLSEQQKITNFLTSVDKVIESKQNQIRVAEIWKKGLLQQMFV